MLNVAVEDLGQVVILHCKGSIVRGEETRVLCAAVGYHGRDDCKPQPQQARRARQAAGRVENDPVGLSRRQACGFGLILLQGYGAPGAGNKILIRLRVEGMICSGIVAQREKNSCARRSTYETAHRRHHRQFASH